MGNWKQDSLVSICNIVKGEQLNKLDLEKSGDYPCINGGIEPSGYTNKWNRFENTITISEGGNSCGYINYLKEKFWSGGHCYTLQEIKDGFNIDYLYYVLKVNEYKIMGLRVGSGLPNIQQKAIKSFEIQYPESKPEQTRIAEILSTADEAIGQTETLIAKYQRIKTGLMQDLLTKGIDENGNIRSKATHKFVVKNGIEVPEEWEVDTFSLFCSIIKDGTHLPPKRVTDGIWLLGVSNIIGGEWTLTNSDTQISEEFYNQMHKNWQIEIGDVLLAIVGATIGKVTQVPTNFPKFTLQRSVCLLRGKEKELSNDFLRLFIESLYFQRLLWNEVNVTAQPGIYLDTIGKFLIGKPRFEEQLMIVDKLSSIKETIDSLLTNLAKLQSLKTGLMQDLLSGKKRLNFD
jgi:type I restriction enzyme, S subunit